MTDGIEKGDGESRRMQFPVAGGPKHQRAEKSARSMGEIGIGIRSMQTLRPGATQEVTEIMREMTETAQDTMENEEVKRERTQKVRETMRTEPEARERRCGRSRRRRRPERGCGRSRRCRRSERRCGGVGGVGGPRSDADGAGGAGGQESAGHGGA